MKLSDDIVLDARLAAQMAERSIASQIEFWAQLGRAIEALLEGVQLVALRRSDKVTELSRCLRSVDTAQGRRRLTSYLESLPFPHYEAASNAPGLLIRTDASGKRTLGKFVKGRFRAARR